MNRKSTLILSFVIFIFSNCCGQSEDSIKQREQRVLEAMRKWAENPALHFDTFDIKILDQLKDSGAILNYLKEGRWVEYSIDSSFLETKTTIIVDEKEIEMPGSITLLKNSGNYTNGKKEGLWTNYISYSQQLPLYWERKKETNFLSGLKNGTETIYQGYGHQTPLLISHFKNDIEYGEGRLYNHKPPYNLSKVYYAINGQLLLLKEYYDDGSVHHIISDTILNNQNLRFAKSFNEKGNLIQTGFYINDTLTHGEWTNFYETGKIKSITTFSYGLENGIYKYYHSNGQLWTERTFENGKAKDILSNFDRNGKPMDKGSLKNGNGTVILYDENGKVTGVQEYKNGKDIRGE